MCLLTRCNTLPQKGTSSSFPLQCMVSGALLPFWWPISSHQTSRNLPGVQRGEGIRSDLFSRNKLVYSSYNLMTQDKPVWQLIATKIEKFLLFLSQFLVLLHCCYSFGSTSGVTDPFEPVQLTNPAENKLHKKTKKTSAALMSFNWLIAESNYTNTGVKVVGLCSWEREGGRKKGRRGRGNKWGRWWEITFPFGQSSAQLSCWWNQAVISHLTIIRWPCTMKTEA